MKGRVNIGGSFSESVAVEDRYDTYIEEHPRVSNRTPYYCRIVDLDGSKPLYLDSISLSDLSWPFLWQKGWYRGKYTFRPWVGVKGFLF